MSGVELKNRWSVSHNPLVGLTLGRWLQLLRDNRFAISPAYWHRAAFLTGIAAINSFYARKERCYDEGISATEIKVQPLFILGHWRSGTTHLHNLMSRPGSGFSYPTNYQAINAATFLWTEGAANRLFAGRVAGTRPMDNVPLDLRTPQEDEFALSSQTLLSPYLGMSFPRAEARYDRYLTFEEADRWEIDAWKSALLGYCRKLTYLHGSRPLVLKSPGHTARIRMLLEVFPDAKFVHIHRHPDEVYRSFRHYWETTVWYWYLQRPDRRRLEESLIRRYRTMHDAYHEQRRLIPAGHLCEVRYEDLEREPVAEVGRIYEALGLPAFDAFQPELADYVASLESYEKNRFKPLEEGLRQRLRQAWQREYETWGYA